jgi:hypothetical protein
MQLHCNNKLCKYNTNMLCGATTIYYVNGRCFTFKRENLMRVDNPNCIANKISCDAFKSLLKFVRKKISPGRNY